MGYLAIERRKTRKIKGRGRGEGGKRETTSGQGRGKHGHTTRAVVERGGGQSW